MMMMSALYLTNTCSWTFIVLAHWNNSPRIYMSLHSDTLFYFLVNQSLLVLLNDTCLAEKQQIWCNLIVFGLTKPWFQLTIYRTRGEHANQIFVTVTDQNYSILVPLSYVTCWDLGT